MIRNYINLKLCKDIISNSCQETINISTISRYFSSFRTLIHFYLREFFPIIELDGPIECDEAFIGAKRRGVIGRIPPMHHTVFGFFTKLQKIK